MIHYDGLPTGYDNWRLASPEDAPELRNWDTHYTPSELDAFTFDAVNCGHTPVSLAAEYEAETITELVRLVMDECKVQLKSLIADFEEDDLHLGHEDIRVSLTRVFAPAFDVKAAA